jgi:hypothetical protein
MVIDMHSNLMPPRLSDAIRERSERPRIIKDAAGREHLEMPSGACLWARELTAPEIAEIDAALASVKPTGLEILDIKRSDFPLPTVGGFLAQARLETLHTADL